MGLVSAYNDFIIITNLSLAYTIVRNEKLNPYLRVSLERQEPYRVSLGGVIG